MTFLSIFTGIPATGVSCNIHSVASNHAEEVVAPLEF
jgi:hypothetical protein